MYHIDLYAYKTIRKAACKLHMRIFILNVIFILCIAGSHGWNY